MRLCQLSVCLWSFYLHLGTFLACIWTKKIEKLVKTLENMSMSNEIAYVLGRVAYVFLRKLREYYIN